MVVHPALRPLAATCILTAALFAAPLPPAYADDAAAAEAPAAGDAQPDGMGHLPGHSHHESGGDDNEDADAHHHHGDADHESHHHGDADHESHHHGDDEAEAESCPMMDGHHDMHEMEGMHGMHEMHEMHAMHHQHGMGAMEGDHGHGDASLAAIAAPPPPHWLHGIELGADQQDRIFAILHEIAPAQRKAQRTAESTHRQLSHAGMASDYSEASTRKLSDQHAQAIAELTMLRIRTEKRILDVLTPEQRRDAAHQAARED